MSVQFFDQARKIARQLAVAGYRDYAFQINETIMFGVASAREMQDLRLVVQGILNQNPNISNDLRQNLRSLATETIAA